MELAWDATYLFIIIWKDIWWRVMRLAGTAAYLKYYYLEGHLVESDGTSMGCCVFKIYTVTIWKDIWWRVMELACAAPHPGGTTARSLSATTNSPGTRTTLCQEIAT